MFEQFIESENLDLRIQQHKPVKRFPNIENRKAWDEVPESLRLKVIKMGEKRLTFQWPSLVASSYMAFAKAGNSLHYDQLYFERRNILAVLVFAECLENKGRFLDAIVNGIWCICEESTWVIPYHLAMSFQTDPDALPDIMDPYIDLFAGETAGLLSMTSYLLLPRLHAISPMLGSRIRLELNRRILEPYLQRDDFWWHGFETSARKQGTWMKGTWMGRVNNWNPWINSNVLATAMMLEDEDGIRTKVVRKAMESLDVFIRSYPPDGGCDEGTTYWSMAGGALFDCLEWLHTASDGAISYYHDPLIRNMGRYIYRAYVDGDYYVNFGDGDARVRIDGELVARYGQRIEDPHLMAMGASRSLYEDKLSDLDGKVFHSPLRWLSTILNAKNAKEWNSETAKAPQIRDVWLENTEFMVARQHDGTSRGLVLAAKGGHNDESHNHNDVGNFILYANGVPVIIDVGVETYNAKTFSPERYELWTMCSSYHNLPTVNGYEQLAGFQYRASHVSYQSTDSFAHLCMDLIQAYPPESNIIRWVRTFHLERSYRPYMEVSDEFALNSRSKELVWNLMTVCKPDLLDSNTIRLKSDDQTWLLAIYNGERYRATYEEIAILDPKLNASWGQMIYRICFAPRDNMIEDRWSVRFELHSA